MAEYLKKRTLLYTSFSDFSCDNYGCKGICCKNSQVFMTLFDLVFLSHDLEKSVSDIFKDYCGIGLDPDRADKDEQGKWDVPARITMKMPCPLLKEDRCSVHETKPIVCAIFPEMHYRPTGLEKYLTPEELEALNQRPNLVSEYPCTQEEGILGPKRATLVGMMIRFIGAERAAQSRFLGKNKVVLSGDIASMEEVERIARPYYKERIKSLDSPEAQDELFSHLKLFDESSS